MQNLPLISVIIPCRNERDFIGKCLDSILDNDYPKDKLEVLVMDGMSEDGTREIIKDYAQKYSFIKLVDNLKKFTPFALNIGIKEAKGEIIIRMDTHAVYKNDYISKCLKYLKDYNADNVGGVIKTVPRENTPSAKAIVIALAHRFGAGDSYFRTGAKEPRWVDTVFGGCYRKEIFKQFGLFNENLLRTQDLEFNLRLKRSGGKILLVPGIVAYYYPNINNLKDLFIYSFRAGMWGIYHLKYVRKPFCLRHYIPLAFVLTLIGFGAISIFSPFFIYLLLLIIGIYLLFSFYFSIKITIKEKNIAFLFLLPLIFPIRHISYGLGSMWGMVKLLI